MPGYLFYVKMLDWAVAALSFLLRKLSSLHINCTTNCYVDEARPHDYSELLTEYYYKRKRKKNFFAWKGERSGSYFLHVSGRWLFYRIS